MTNTARGNASPMMEEVADIIRKHTHINEYDIEAVLTVMGSANYDFFTVTKLDKSCDFAGSFTEMIMIEGYFPAGTFYYRVLPNKEELTCTVSIKPAPGKQGLTQTATYDAFLILDNEDTKININSRGAPTEARLNHVDLYTIKLQLIPKTLNELRKQYIGTVVRQATAEQACRAIVQTEAAAYTYDLLNRITELEMVPADNQMVREAIVIPQNTRLIDLPYFLQEKEGGLYKNGISSYIHRNTWHIFPTFQYAGEALFSSQNINLFVVNKTVIGDENRTWCRSGNTYKIMSMSDTQMVDLATPTEANDGSQSQVINTASAMEDMYLAAPDEDKIFMNQGKSSRIVGFAGRLTNSTFIVPDLNTDTNVFSKASQIAIRRGGFLTVEWRCCSGEIFKPNQTVEFYYETDNGIESSVAKVMKVHYYYSKIAVSYAGTPFRVACAIQLFFTPSVHDTGLGLKSLVNLLTGKKSSSSVPQGGGSGYTEPQMNQSLE